MIGRHWVDLLSSRPAPVRIALKNGSGTPSIQGQNIAPVRIRHRLT